MSPNEKNVLRDQLWQKMNQFTDEDQINLSQKIQHHLSIYLKKCNMTLFGGFIPVRKEPNIWPILAHWKSALALPVYNKSKDNYVWGPYNTPLKNSKFNIPEPPTAFKHPPKLDICLVPALGIDPNGNRIGWGHGYFDRLISREIPIRIGVIYERQKIKESFTPDEWDIPLTHCLTESGLKKLNNNETLRKN